MNDNQYVGRNKCDAVTLAHLESDAAAAKPGSVPSPASIGEVAAVRACEAIVRRGQGFPGAALEGLLDVHAFAFQNDVSDLGSPAYWSAVSDLIEDGLDFGDWTPDEVDTLCCLFNTYQHRAHSQAGVLAGLLGSTADWGIGVHYTEAPDSHAVFTVR